MVDVIEIPPPAVDQTGTLTVWWVPTIADVTAPKVTEIKAAGSKKVTYSFTPGGWNPVSTQGVLKDARATLPQDLESLDKVVAGLTLQYVDSDDASSAAVVCQPGAGYFVERRKIPNQTDAIVAQKVRVFQVTLGKQNYTPPTDNTGKWLIDQIAALGNVVGAPVALVA